MVVATRCKILDAHMLASRAAFIRDLLTTEPPKVVYVMPTPDINLLKTEPSKVVYVMPTADIRLGAFNDAGDDDTASCPGAPDRKRAASLEKKMLMKEDVAEMQAKAAEMKVLAASPEGKIAVAVFTAHLNVCRTLSKIRKAARAARAEAREAEAAKEAAKHARHLALRASLGLDVMPWDIAAVVPSRADKARQAHVKRVLKINDAKKAARKAAEAKALPPMCF
jgi:hypothetical protein